MNHMHVIQAFVIEYYDLRASLPTVPKKQKRIIISLKNQTKERNMSIVLPVPTFKIPRFNSLVTIRSYSLIGNYTHKHCQL